VFHFIGSGFSLLVDVFKMQLNHLLSCSKDISILMMQWSYFAETIQEERIPEQMKSMKKRK
jgi:spore coat protein CotF